MTTACRAVLVVGPPLSGVDSLITGLRGQLPDVTLVGANSWPAGRIPDAVLAVVSGVAPVARSDWALVERWSARTELLVGVVSKIDAHRGWREVLSANRTLVAGWDDRAAAMPWVGVAAAPDLGAPSLEELLGVLREQLADGVVEHRNGLHGNRVRVASDRMPHRLAATAATRSALQRTRLRLLGFVRDGCSTLRGDLRDVASEMPVGGSADFEALVRADVDRFLVELDQELDREIGVVASTLGLGQPAPETVVGRRPPDIGRSPVSSRRLEGRLMAVFGVGFGLGIAVAASRLLAALAPGLPAAGLAVGAVAGLALVVWVVRARGLLHDRAVLDRWVTEVTAAVRWHGEAMIAERLLAAEAAWAAARSVRTTDSVDPRWTAEDVTEQYVW
ncbi:hypothetical protein [Mycolicibacterium sp.]|uniref:hypothetical protein n=1 Tax=Mycolicibacterium sp. TaxID=2320850 RepID=UPI001A20FB22|nr:hypothetical protein [Mycolicibacterium sp.]MBJ7340055.1 hypothetical protein [Mycolicibacterium sp.]